MEVQVSKPLDSCNPSTETKEHEEPNSRDVQRPLNARAKFLCSYGGRIQPRPHDNRLSYCGGETKILSVDRSMVCFSTMMAKLSSLSGTAQFSLKYQLPGEDLDALISVTNDEDLVHLMAEHDQWGVDRKVRLFLFDAGRCPPASTPDFLLGLIDSPGNPPEKTPAGEKGGPHLAVSSVEGREIENQSSEAASGGNQTAYAFPPPPPPPVAPSVQAGGPALGYFPVVVGPGFMGVPHQAVVLPASHFSGAGFRRVGSENSLVNAGQPVCGSRPLVSVDAEYQFPLEEDDGPRRVPRPEMRAGKPPLPV